MKHPYKQYCMQLHGGWNSFGVKVIFYQVLINNFFTAYVLPFCWRRHRSSPTAGACHRPKTSPGRNARLQLFHHFRSRSCSMKECIYSVLKSLSEQGRTLSTKGENVSLTESDQTFWVVPSQAIQCKTERAIFLSPLKSVHWSNTTGKKERKQGRKNSVKRGREMRDRRRGGKKLQK